MIVNFSALDLSESPLLLLKNAQERTIGPICHAADVEADLNYNEISVLSFRAPDRYDGAMAPYYDDIVGRRIVELAGVGQFILMDPEETDNGLYKMKTCSCKSLEYEFTFKKLSLPNGTYCFWDPTSGEESLIDIIMDLMPSWKIGKISDALVGVYRTFEVKNEKLYSFMKNTAQKSYGCIFDFDTMTRTVNVRAVSDKLTTRPVYISTENLAKEIEICEDTENIYTRLDVNGADGINIREANPCGTNRLINLDYYMNEKNFDSTLIDKYHAWQELCAGSQHDYYRLYTEYSAEMMKKSSESVKLSEYKNQLASAEGQQALIIQGIAMGGMSQSDLNAINLTIAGIKENIIAAETQVSAASERLADILESMTAIQSDCSFENYFSESELLQLDRYIKDTDLSDNSFIVAASDGQTDMSAGVVVEDKRIYMSDGVVRLLEDAGETKIFDIVRGRVLIDGMLDAKLGSGTLDVQKSGEAIFTSVLREGTFNGTPFTKGSITITCTAAALTHDCVEADETGAVFVGSSIGFDISDGYICFSADTGDYERRKVIMDLYEYGVQVLDRLAWPAYTFSVSCVNFFKIADFVSFKNQLRLGESVYLDRGNGNVLRPICIGVRLGYGNQDGLELKFSDSYSARDSAFRLVDLLEQSISAGKEADLSKYKYSAFVDGGAEAAVARIIDSALDVSRNAIISSNDQAISWDGAGLRLRKWTNQEKTAYEDEQIWMNNNSIMMTSDGWATAEMAVGKFQDSNLGECWGIVAPKIVGTLLAGGELIIESAKKDGDVAVFKMDGDGCRLVNSDFSVHGNDAHIALNPEVGIMIGKYPLYSNVDGVNVVNDGNRNFWVDTNGDVHIKGVLHAATGEFTGAVVATSLVIQSGGEDIDIDDYIVRASGSAVESIAVEYYLSESQDALIGGEWLEAPPEWTDGMHMWQRTKIVYASGVENYSTATPIPGAHGKDGRGIDGIAVQYYLSSSSSDLIDGEWGYTPPSSVDGKYIWTRHEIVYTDGTVGYTDAGYDAVWESIRTLTTDVEASFNVLSDSISSKVSQESFDAFGKEVHESISAIEQNASEITIKVQAAQSTANEAQASADALADRVSKAEAEISVQADQIKATVTKEEFVVVEQAAQQAQNTANSAADAAAAAQSTADEAQEIASANAENIDELIVWAIQADTKIAQTADKITLTATKEELVTVQQAASNAQSTANSASNAASNAQSAANNAAQAAQQAQSTANNAAGAASNAQSTADGASNAASNAQSAANNAAQAAQQAQSTANEAQANTQALAQRVTKAESEIAVQADEIALRVTKTQYETGLDGKLDADKPSVGVQTASAVVNEKGVYLSGGEIDMRTTDGEDYLNLSSAGVSASSMGAPNVMPRYDKWEYLAVTHDESQLAAPNAFRSLQDALNHLNGKVVDKPVRIALAFYDNDYGDATLQGAVFTKGLTITNDGFTPTIVGKLTVEGCSGNIFINNTNFSPVNGTNAINISGCVYVEMENCIFKGNGNGYGIVKFRGGEAYVYHCEFYNFLRSVVARAGAHVTMIECKGNSKIAADRGGIINTCGYMPDSNTSFNAEQSWGGKVFTDNTYVNQGSGGSTPAVPTVGTLSVGVNAAVSYRASGGVWSSDSVIQGWWDGGGRIKGCMWFDNAAIRNTLSGKTVLTASLRLHMNSSARGTQVTVELAGTGTNYGGGNPAVTKTYGAIATMSPKETATITLPVQAVNDLVSGTINGLMLYSSDTGPHKEREYSKNYAAFTGASGDSSTRPMLTITYEG